MTNHMDLWNAVERTPAEHTKPITGKQYSGTSPKPHYIIQKATQTFGPAGIGWGFTVEDRIIDGAMLEPGFFEKLHVAKVKVWYLWNNQRGEVEHIGGTVFSGRRKDGKPFTDEDAPKKSVTDALIKALSMIGFAGDIFMGRYDDSKYVSELREEAVAAKREAEKPKQLPAPDASVMAKLFDEGNAAADFGSNALKAYWTRLKPDQKRALGGEAQIEKWKAIAKKADEANGPDESPFNDAPMLEPAQ